MEFSNINKEQGVYFCPEYPLSQINFNSILSDVKSIETIGRTGFISSGNTYPIKIYSNNLLYLYTPKLSAGLWLKASNNKNSYLHAVCSHNATGINAGTVLSGKILRDNSSGEIPISIEVVGILDSPNIPLDFGTSGNRIKISDLLIPDSSFNQLPTLLISKSELSNYCDISGDISNVLLLFNSSTPLNKNITLLKNFGTVNSISSIENNQKDDLLKQLKVFIPYLIIITIMIIIGIIGLTLLSIYQNLKEFAIYYMAGCSTANCLRICLCYIFLIIGIASMVSIPIITWVYSPSNRLAMEIVPNSDNVFAFIFLWIITILVSLIELKIIFRKFSIAQIMRTKN